MQCWQKPPGGQSANCDYEGQKINLREKVKNRERTERWERKRENGFAPT